MQPIDSASPLNCVVLDDYQAVAAHMADWDALSPRVRTRFLHDPIADEALLVEALADADIVVLTRERTALLAPTLHQLPRLKLVVTLGFRNGALDVMAAQRQGIVVCGTDTVESPTVELTWGLILALARRLPDECAHFRAGVRWQSTLGTDLAGKTLGILGLGRLGCRVARVAQAFDMDVAAWSQNLDDARCAAFGVRRAPSLHALLEQADIATVHLVLSPRTLGLIGAEQLACMKPGALLVNASRPGIVDEQALMAVLQQGRLGGAALDVFSKEPLPPDHPLRRTGRLIATPHLGYITENSYRLMFGMAVEDIAAWLAGAPLREIAEDRPARQLAAA